MYRVVQKTAGLTTVSQKGAVYFTR